jgi:hypothetical protein
MDIAIANDSFNAGRNEHDDRLCLGWRVVNIVGVGFLTSRCPT